MAAAAPECPAEPLDSEHPLFVLYTSGSTAKPKGILHTTGGYLTGVSATYRLVFDLRPETDVYWCAADVGWVTGHSYIVYGPLCNGATSVMWEGAPDYPDRGYLVGDRRALWGHDLYCAPTAIRACIKWGAEWPNAHDLSSLRLLGSVGEPINPKAWLCGSSRRPPVRSARSPRRGDRGGDARVGDRRPGGDRRQGRAIRDRGPGRPGIDHADPDLGDRRVARLDVDAAAARAAALIPVAAAAPSRPPAARRGVPQPSRRRREPGAAVERHPLPPDAAKLALRAVYSHSQADPALLAALAGPRDLHRGEAAGPRRTGQPRRRGRRQGRPARGEDVFRRRDLNCMTCHAVSKAGGDIGADLSAFGDLAARYVVDSILVPDQSIKEQYHTLIVLTATARCTRASSPTRTAGGSSSRTRPAPSHRPGRLDRGTEGGRLADAQGAGQPDDARRVR